LTEAAVNSFEVLFLSLFMSMYHWNGRHSDDAVDP
jgi:hypothetical protein